MFNWQMNREDLQNTETIPSLNGIRAISVLVVMVAHAGFGSIVPGGLGVTAFFFLSGYLITTLMLSEYRRSGHINIPNFYLRRCFRLYPPLLVTLAISYGLVASGLLPGGVTLKGLLSQLLYFANYYGIFFDNGNTVPAGTGILWSLAVEEHFYIFYPLMMTLMLRRSLPPRTIGAVFCAICIVTLAWRMFLVHSDPSFPDRTYYASDTRIDSIVYGCLLAVMMNPLRHINLPGTMTIPQWTLLAAGFLVLLMTIIYRGPFFRETFRYSLQGLSLLPIFYFSIRFHDNALFRYLNSRWIMQLGIWSYSIYLIHQVVIFLLGANFPALSNSPILMFAVTLALSTTYAAAIDRWVDPYFRQLRRQYRPDAARPNLAFATRE